jgi:acetylornithine deacetylase/succinyl-diaminopimelate desuccinylase-like protein
VLGEINDKYGLSRRYLRRDLSKVNRGSASPAGQDHEKEVLSYLNSKVVKHVFLRFEEKKPTMKDEWKQMARLYAPSGNEVFRAEYITKRFKEHGIDAYIDALGNAVGLIKGKSAGPTVVFLGTMDDLATVAEMVKAWDKPIEERDGKLIGPGTNSSATCASILGLAEIFMLPEVRFSGRIYLVGVVQEETGLTGIKGFLRDHFGEVDYLVDIMAGIGSISYGALGINWFKVHFKGPRGHTLSGGLPNVTRGVAKAVDRVSAIAIPSEPPERGTFLNIAMLGAGKVFNHKYDDGWFSVDLRSMDSEVLAYVKDQILSTVKEVALEEQLEWWIEPFSETPGGQIPGARDSKLVRIAEEATKALGGKGTLSNRGSSNMNVGIAQRISTISIGGNRGGERDTPQEYANIEPVLTGIKLNFLIGYILTQGETS